MTEYRKKLIEVALPLEAINRASAHEKLQTRNHPSTLHLWWARRPLATCRAMLFASLVDDPSAQLDQFPTEEAQEAERQRLFRIIEELVKWENSTNEAVFDAARAEIMRSTDGNPPPVLDPFCGGGSIPLEAQRLGLEALASDLNPVAVVITKALIEIPPRFAGLPSVNPDAVAKFGNTGRRGAESLAEDVRYYGRWMCEEAERRIGHLYPKVTLPGKYGGGEATVIAWLWARTVTCPNPACGADMPLVRSFALSTKKGKQAWVEPIVDAAAKIVRFEVRTGAGVAPQGTVDRRGARCIVCGSSVPFTHVRSEGQKRGLGVRQMAVVAEGKRGRVYVTPDEAQTAVAESAVPSWSPEAELPHNPRDFKTPNYGMTTFAQLFTARQLVALSSFSDLVAEAREQVLRDALSSGLADDGVRLSDGGSGAAAYADAMAVYLSFPVDRGADYWSSIATWHSGNQQVRCTFARQAIPMTWDYVEANPFSGSSGSWVSLHGSTVGAMSNLPAVGRGAVRQLDAAAAAELTSALVSTDPPYYDNIGYADLSDFFYVWLRRSLHGIYPELFSTLLVPKAQEIVATPYRFGGDKKKAEQFFEKGLGQAFAHLRRAASADYPLTVYYAFKQTENAGDEASPASTGWQTMLEGLLASGLTIEGTWPVRTELASKVLGHNANILASSIVLVCRRRSPEAPLSTRKEFLGALRAELPGALVKLQHGNIAPVDLAQASIGPGMAVFSRFSKVLEADGSPMSVRTALALINQALDEVVAEQEGEFDADTRWAIAWFEEVGMDVGEFGRAELLSKAKNTSVEGMVEAGIVESKGGKVRLLPRNELDEAWEPTTDKRLTVWEMTQHLLRRLDEGEAAAAALARHLGSNAEVARDLAYRLYLVCERKKWSQEGQAYNGLVVAWPQIAQLAASVGSSATTSQEGLF